MVKINEKTFLWTAIIFVVFSAVLFFRSCNISGDSGTDTAITRAIQSIARTIRSAVEIAQDINGDYNELVRERDNYKLIAEQAESNYGELENRYSELQDNYNGLREYQSRKQQEIRDLERTCIELGIEIDGFGSDVGGLGKIIRAIQDGAETAQD